MTGCCPDWPMKILIIAGYYKPAYVYGGPVRSLSALAEGLAQHGVSVSVSARRASLYRCASR